ncbi:4-hydroxy-tetrahydrodipicolinate reductase [Rhodovulum sp. DZ06]|uniref:4-hydroxy-tetrahydrodipicolinate reductase n=1 Tax=Rhodovulum sp. DZ06 TaxID=3425126 RepID=UPI003D331C62
MSAIPVTVAGCSGRMGRMLMKAVIDNPDTRLVGATERPGSEWVGKDVAEILGGAPTGVLVEDDMLEPAARSRAILDFTSPAATLAHATLAAQARCVHVIGTTGFEKEDLDHLAAAARHAVIVRAGNMSLGVNLLTQMTKKVAAALDADWDVEIVEMHHNRKVDAPSGTALMLGEAAAEGRGVSLEEMRDSGRDGITGARDKGRIGFAALRGGDVVGEHEVIFAAEGERITLKHIATDRGIFARGAVKAAIWGQSQKPGEYEMIDVLGLR